jgi:hypothetical protein
MASETPVVSLAEPRRHIGFMLIVSWLWVCVPLAWGVIQTMKTSLALFR